MPDWVGISKVFSMIEAGIVWLANTTSISDLMLNAVALGAVLDVASPHSRWQLSSSHTMVTILDLHRPKNSVQLVP